MNQAARDIIDRGMNDLPEASPPEKPQRPVITIKPEALMPQAGEFAPTLEKSESPAQLYMDIDRALGSLPTRFWRDARAVARRLGCADELAAVEAAHDAIVSTRE